MAQKDGKKAFPLKTQAGVQRGMDLRDYFAAQAMQGFLASTSGGQNYFPTDQELANASYHVADAMMLERKKGIE